MNIRTYTEQETIYATSRLKLPREVNANMNGWNRLAHMFHVKVTFVPGMERPIGPLGNYMQTLTVTIEGDYDDPKCQQLFDAIYSKDPEKLAQIKKEIHTGSVTDDASTRANTEDQPPARSTQKYTAPQSRPIAVNNSDTAPLVKRIFMFLEDEEWDRANAYCETVLDLEPENAYAYLGMLMAELEVSHVRDLKDQAEPFDSSKNYQKAVRYANEKMRSSLIGCIEHINNRNEKIRLEGIYISTLQALAAASSPETRISEQDVLKIAQQFEAISHYKDAADKARECYEKIDEIRLEKKRQEETAQIEDERRARERQIAKRKAMKACMIVVPIVVLLIAVLLLIANVIISNNRYKDAVILMDTGKYEEAIGIFEKLGDYQDSVGKISQCQSRINYLDASKESIFNEFQQIIADVYARQNDSAPDITAVYESTEVNGDNFILKGKYYWRFIDGNYANFDFTITGEFDAGSVSSEFSEVYYTNEP